MMLLELNYDRCGIARALVLSNSNAEYCVNVDIDRGFSWCDCPYYFFHKTPCKHINFVMPYLDYSKMNDERSELMNLTTGSDIIDEILGGGVPIGITTAFTGVQEAGKSFLLAQLALSNIEKFGTNSIIIETEGYREEDYKEKIAGKMLDRFNLKKSDLNKLKFISIVSDWEENGLQKLCKLLGLELRMIQKKQTDLNKGSKIQVHFIPCKPGLNKKLLDNTGFIGLDSLTAPIKFNIGSEQQNLPARAQIEERIFGKSFMLAKTFDCAFAISHHISIDPTNPRDLGTSYGGRDVLYNSKYGVQIMHGIATGRAKWGNEARRVMMVRIPGIQKNWEKFDVRLKKDYGFCDE